MNSQINLEIKGNLREHRLAELLIEIFRANLNGSLRVSATSQKIVVYFDAGDVVFAVSNARAHRLFELLLRENKITKQQLAAIADFTNDLALKAHLLKNNLLPKSEIDALFSRQIGEILKDAFDWRAGEWIFSPFVRIKGDIRFKVDAASLLLEHARNLPDEELERNFKNIEEVFKAEPTMPAGVNLLPEEAFVFSRFENASLNVEKVLYLSGLPDSATLRILYTLWLGGFLARRNWNSPFSDRNVSAILSANLTLKKDEKTPPASIIAETLPGFSKIGLPKIQPPTVEQKVSPAETGAPVETAISLEDYLERTQNAPNYYRIFDVAPDAPVSEVKQAYFTLARRFHPDLFHTEIYAEKHRRIQNAFTIIAQAYETLKNESTRTVYDYRTRKELAEMEKTAAADAPENPVLQKQTEQAKGDYERGFSLLLEGNYEDALPFLARAAHLVENNAHYRAYYGKALAADGAQKHKAEAEMQAALWLEPDNADVRLMLAEFFVQVNLLKRAEGELNRLLANCRATRRRARCSTVCRKDSKNKSRNFPVKREKKRFGFIVPKLYFMKKVSIAGDDSEEKILKIARAVDEFEAYAGDHAARIAVLSDALAQKFNLAAQDRFSLRQAAFLHDIGEMTMNREYIKANRRLSDTERLDVERHTVIGEQEAAKRGLSRAVQLLVRWHHEWWNGGGYPDAINREQIPLAARILRVSDAFAALTADRPYRAAVAAEEAERHLTEGAGIEFDPKIVKMFLSLEELKES